MPTLATIKADTRRALLAAQTGGVPFDPALPIEGYVAIIDGVVLETAAIHDTNDCTAGQNGPGNLYSIQEIELGNGGGAQCVNGVLYLTGPQIDAMLAKGMHRCRGPVCRHSRGEG
jgi:hypothetical protein